MIDAGDINYDRNCDRCYFLKNGQKYCPGNWLLNDSKFIDKTLYGLPAQY